MNSNKPSSPEPGGSPATPPASPGCWFDAHPAAARAIPFLVFLGVTLFQGRSGGEMRFWLYGVKTLAGLALVALTWRSVREMRWAFSWQAVVVGLAMCGVWLVLDGVYPTVDELVQHYLRPALAKVGLGSLCPKPTGPRLWWDPVGQFGIGSGMAWFFIVVRIAGSTLVVPALEEVFYRSFLYRYVSKVDFLSIPLGKFLPLPFVVVTVLFGFEHQEWLPGLICGAAYQGLVCWKKRLGDAMTAHAITNLTLGVWVAYIGAWKLW